ncbi:MAG TPA: hypothetical protein VHR86_08280, partial [Armatimonadota bacterium]|nr:hypothetical protein [Armatimonadota bacterium]
MTDVEAGREALLDSLHSLEVHTLAALEKGDAMDEAALAAASGLQEAQVRTALGWLLSKELVTVVRETVRQEVSLTETGRAYAEKGTPEERILRHLQTAGATRMADLVEAAGIEKEEQSGSIGTLRAAGAITIGKGGVVETAAAAVPETVAQTRALLEAVKSREGAPLESYSDSEQQHLQEMAGSKRKGKGLVSVDTRRDRTYSLTEEGHAVAQLLAERGYREEVSQLTPEMLKDGSWRNVRFRPYYIGLNPPRMQAGKKSAYGQFLQFVKTRLLAMGFTQMRGSMVENEFWDMDA